MYPVTWECVIVWGVEVQRFPPSFKTTNDLVYKAEKEK